MRSHNEMASLFVQDPIGNEKRIEGGFILLARKLLKSGIMEKPPLFIKLWTWMLLQASHTGHGNLKRGQFFTSLERMQKAMTYKVGYRTVKPSIKEIRGITKFLTKGGMAVTTKVPRGLLITILNYDFYQDWKNYEGHSEGHNEGSSRGTLYIKEGKTKKGDNKPPLDVASEILLLKKRYSDYDLIEQAFEAIRSTRKSGKVADAVILSQLQKWGRYPAPQVEAGIKIYLEKDYAGEGKAESYLLGVIRNQNHKKNSEQNQTVAVFQSTGSPLLDRAMRENWGPATDE